MPRKSKLGKFFNDSAKHKLDLIVKARSTGQKIGISIRNHRETLYPRHSRIREMVRFRETFGIPCILVASFISADAKKRLLYQRSGQYELRGVVTKAFGRGGLL